MLSKEGQEVVVKDGYMPLHGKQVQEELAKITSVDLPQAGRGVTS